MIISLGEIFVIALVGLMILKPCEILPIMKWLSSTVRDLKMKISTVLSQIKDYFK